MKVSVHFPHVHRDIDRHGNVRIYFRRAVGLPKIRLRSKPGTSEFALEYERAKSQGTIRVDGEVPVKVERPRRGTLGWLCQTYLSSSEFTRLNVSTQATRRRILYACAAERVAPTSSETFEEFPLDRLTAKALRVLRDRKADLPGAANDRVKTLRAMFTWAAEHDLVDANPSLELKRIRYSTSGHLVWSTAEVLQFETHHPIGSKARLALALLLWTGLRRSDVVCLGKQHVKDGWLKISLQKNRARTPVTVELPIAVELSSIIAASPIGHLTFLTTDYGKPFSIAGFGQWFRDRCDEAGLTQCAAHGLRKAGATRAAENGATAHELMAMFGWLSLSEAQRYTRSADRRVLARNAAKLLSRENK